MAVLPQPKSMVNAMNEISEVTTVPRRPVAETLEALAKGQPIDRSDLRAMVDGGRQWLRGVGEQVFGPGGSRLDALNRKAEENAERVGDYVANSTGREVVDDATDLVRKYPLQALAVGVGVGLLASRLLRR